MSDVVSNKTTPFHWEVDENTIHYISDNGKRCQVKKLIYIANGTKDTCSVKDKKGTLALRTKQTIKPTDTVLCEWSDDIIIIQFFKPLPAPFNKKVLYMEMNDSLVPFIDTVFRLHPSMKPDHYDAHLGRRFPSLESTNQTLREAQP